MLHKKRFKKNKVKSIVKLKNNILKIISYKWLKKIKYNKSKIKDFLQW
jgi:hypothetical protein